MFFKRILLLAALLFSVQSLATDYEQISFKTLTSHITFEKIEDPYLDLNFDNYRPLDMLEKITLITDYVDAKARGDELTEYKTKQYQETKAELEKNEVDVDGYLKARAEMAAKWRFQKESTNPELENKNIAMKGLILPLEFENKKVTEFLLVPYHGACIHLPPPPANLIVYTKLKTPISIKNLDNFTAITVKGKLKTEEKLVDLHGVKSFSSSYVLDVDSVEFPEE